VDPHVRQNCDRFPSHLRRFAPIFVDVLADHCLSLAWQDYYDTAAVDFSEECYAAIAAHELHLTANARRFFDYMREVDLLANYDEWTHVARGLKSVLRRLDRQHWFADVEQVSRAAVPGSHVDFSRYYPSLRNAWTDWDAFDALRGG